jgi:hypothetical protein
VDEPYLRKFLRKVETSRRDSKANTTEYFSTTNSQHTLIESRSTEVRCNLELSFVNNLKKTRSFVLSSQVVIPRSEKVLQLANSLKERFAPTRLPSLNQKEIFIRASKK